MALSVSVRSDSPMDMTGKLSSGSYVYCDLFGDSSYPNGYPVTPGTFGLTSTIIDIIPVRIGSYVVWYDPVLQVIRFMTAGASPSSEVANGTNLVGVTQDALVIGY